MRFRAVEGAFLIAVTPGVSSPSGLDNEPSLYAAILEAAWPAIGGFYILLGILLIGLGIRALQRRLPLRLSLRPVLVLMAGGAAWLIPAGAVLARQGSWGTLVLGLTTIGLAMSRVFEEHGFMVIGVRKAEIGPSVSRALRAMPSAWTVTFGGLHSEEIIGDIRVRERFIYASRREDRAKAREITDIVVDLNRKASGRIDWRSTVTLFGLGLLSLSFPAYYAFIR